MLVEFLIGKGKTLILELNDHIFNLIDFIETFITSTLRINIFVCVVILFLLSSHVRHLLMKILYTSHNIKFVHLLFQKRFL